MTQLQTFDDTQKLIQKYGTRDPFELIDALPNTKLWPARSLDADGLRGFATIVNRVRYIAVYGKKAIMYPTFQTLIVQRQKL